jgi:isopenicillin N synthase-like dioxygenase
MTTPAVDIDRHPIANSVEFGSAVPVIDIGALVGPSDEQASALVVQEIAQACRDWGFFQVVNHGVSADRVSRGEQHARRFFNRPLAEKSSVMRSRDNPWGYNNGELTKNQRDKKEVFDFTRGGVDPVHGNENRWPAGDDPFKAVMLDYFDACTGLSLHLLGAFFVGLEMPRDFLQDAFKRDHTGFMRLNYYPIDDPLAGNAEIDVGLGIHHHTDAGALTVLHQDDIGGLQVYRDGFWHDIPPVDDAFVINIGDMFQVWSNDVYRAPIHRVLAMESTERYSMPFFLNPPPHANIEPLQSVVRDNTPPRYRSLEWADFRRKRADGDFSDYGKEVQISQYRLNA